MIICLLIPLSTVSASDINNTAADDQVLSATPSVDTLSASVNLEQENDTLSVQNDENLLSAGSDSGSDNLLGDDGDSGEYTLVDLGKLIKYTPDSLVVPYDIKYNSTKDGDGLVISKNNYIIDFNGKTLDASGSFGTILTVTGNNVTIKNLNLKNGVGDWILSSFLVDLIATIEWDGDNGLIENMLIYNSTKVLDFNGKGKINGLNITECYGSTVVTLGENSTAEHVYAYNNTDNKYADDKCFFMVGSYSILKNSVFDDPDVCQEVGLGFNTGQYECQLINCTFKNIYGESVTIMSANSIIKDCNFTVNNNYRCLIFAASAGVGTIIDNCIFDKCNGTGSGFGGNNQYVTLKNSKIINSKFNHLGNLLFIENVLIENNTFVNYAYAQSGGSLSYCNFTNNTLTNKKFGLIRAESLSVDHCNFFNNSLAGENGIIQGLNNKLINVVNSNFTTNESEYDGWAIKSTQNNVAINIKGNDYNNKTNPAVFLNHYSEAVMNVWVTSDNDAVGDGSYENPYTLNDGISYVLAGGTIHFLNDGIYTLVNSPTFNKQIIVKGNNSIIQGDTYYINIAAGGSKSVIENLIFTGFTGSQVFNFNSYYGEIKNCTFKENTVKNYIILVSARSNTIDDCTFISNTITTSAVIHSDSLLSTISNCRFIDNTGGWAGGIYAFSNNDNNGRLIKFTIENCNFTGNKATSTFSLSNLDVRGVGAVSITGLYSRVTGCRFEDNTGEVGALAINLAETLENCTFINNHGKETLYINTENLNVNKCNFTSNENNENGNVYVPVDGVSFNKCEFDNIQSDDVGIINTASNCNYTITVENSNFTNNDGRIFNLNDYNIIISDNSLFINNSGGVINENGNGYGSLKITDSTFENNTGCDNGSAILFKGSSSISNSNFTSNNATMYGGALYLIGNDAKISNSRFKGNNATLGGGAIYILGDNLMITDSIFTYNNAKNSDYSLGDGGAVYVNGTYSEFKNCIFTDNVASHYGGAIYIHDRENDLYYTIDGQTRKEFSNNKALNETSTGEYDDGTKYDYTHVYVKGASELLSEVYVVKNPEEGADGSQEHPTSFYDGFKKVASGGSIIFAIKGEIFDSSHDGTVYSGQQMSLTKSDVKFLGNSTIIKNLRFLATESAKNTLVKNITFIDCSDSVIIFNATGCIVDDCVFKDNSIETKGNNSAGLAIQVLAENIIINNTKFIDNEMSAEGFDGGVLYINASNVDVINCTFTNNTGPVSNIIVGDDLEYITITGSRFIEGGRVDSDGVAISVGSGINVLNINECNFTGLSANDNGGAVRLSGNYYILNLNDNNFTDNSANNGGAVYLNIGKSSEFVTIVGNNFTDNSANNGGALYVNNVPKDYVLTDNIFDANTAINGGSLFVANGTSLIVNDIAFTSGCATLGGAVYVDSLGSAIFNDCNFTYNNATKGSALYVKGTVTMNNGIVEGNRVDGGDIVGYGDICISGGSFGQNNVKFDYYEGDKISSDTSVSRYMNYVGNDTTYVLNVIYVKMNAQGMGYDVDHSTNWENALNIADKVNSTIIFVDDFTFDNIKTIQNMNLTLTSLPSTNIKIKNNNKYLFNQPKNAKNKKKLCKNISFQLIIYPPI